MKTSIYKLANHAVGGIACPHFLKEKSYGLYLHVDKQQK